MTSWHHHGFFFVFGWKGQWGMKPVETTPLEGRVKVDISLHKSVTLVTIYVFINFNAEFSY
jgi:hypothetical protein